MKKKTAVAFAIILCLLVFPATPKNAEAQSSNNWAGVFFCPQANTNNNHQVFLSDFEALVGKLKTKGVNTVVFDMNYSAYHFTSTQLLNSYGYPASGGFTAQEANQMAQIVRTNGMKVMVGLQILTHSVGNVYPYLYPEYMLIPEGWQENTSYLYESVSYNGQIYRSKQPHTSSLSNTPPNDTYWTAIDSDVRDPFNVQGEVIVFGMIDELINTFTVNGVKPDGFHVGGDELAAWYSNPMQTKGMTSAQIYAMAMTNAYSHIKAGNPNMEVVMWGDMLDSHWNGAPLTANNGGGRDTAGAIDLIPKGMIIADWRYDRSEGDPVRYDPVKKIYPSIGEFINKSFRVWPTSWADPAAAEDMVWTENMEQARTGKVMGHLHSTWLGGIVPELKKLLDDSNYQVPDSVLGGISDADKPRFRQYYRGVADAISAVADLTGLQQCRGTDYYCGAYPNCADCNVKDGYYGTEFKDYYCSNNAVAYSLVNFPNDYLSYWKFNGNTNDEKNLASGTLQNGASIVSDVTRGQVANFDGDNDYISTTSPSSLRINHLGNKVTMSAWVYWKGQSGSLSRIGGFQGYDGDYALWVKNDGQILFEVDGENDNYIYSSATISSNAWHHVAATFENGAMRVYIDGNIIRQVTPPFFPPEEGTAGLAFGNSEDVYFKGMIDDAMIFGRVLSPAEIKRLYADQGGEGGFVRETPSNFDINEDFEINTLDFGILKTDFLKLAASLANPRSDIDGDGQATIKDVGILMSGWR